MGTSWFTIASSMSSISSRSRLLDSSHHAEIEQADDVVAHDDDVAGVGVRMIEAVGEDHFEVQFRAPARHFCEVHAGGEELLGLRHGHALDSLHRQYPGRAQLADRMRNPDAGVVREHARRIAADCALRGQSPVRVARCGPSPPRWPPDGTARTPECARPAARVRSGRRGLPALWNRFPHAAL